jgi:integrase
MTFHNDYRAYMLLKNSGFRRAEALTLTLDNILLGEEDDKEIRVRENEYFGFVPKGNKKRTLPIVDERFKTFLIEDISRRGENEKYYLDNGKGEPYLTSYDRFTTRFKEHCVDLGIAQKKPRLKPLHAFRATYITYLVNKGINIFTIMKIVGHDSIETTQRYVNQNKEQIREALTHLND